MIPARTRALYLTGPEKVELCEVETPRPGPGELLLAIDFATTCGTDLKVFRRGGHPRMLVVPGPFGHEMTGRVAAVGPGCDRFSEGDALIVANSASCGICRPCLARRENLCERLLYLNGAFADYLLVPEPFVRRSSYERPPGLPAGIASLAEPLACVEHGLERLALERPGEALVLGAGSLGLLFVAALVAEGHAVTAADPHPERRQAALALGARGTLDVDRAAVTVAPRRFDTAIDATGTLEGWSAATAAVTPGGTALFFGGCAPDATLALPTYPLHYDELALLGCYHHTPRSFARAVERLAADPARFAALVSGECGLEGVETALRDMQARRAIKVRVRP
jgi:L-iditol 2-dehydrogenase